MFYQVTRRRLSTEMLFQTCVSNVDPFALTTTTTTGTFVGEISHGLDIGFRGTRVIPPSTICRTGFRVEHRGKRGCLGNIAFLGFRASLWTLERIAFYSLQPSCLTYLLVGFLVLRIVICPLSVRPFTSLMSLALGKHFSRDLASSCLILDARGMRSDFLATILLFCGPPHYFRTTDIRRAEPRRESPPPPSTMRLFERLFSIAWLTADASANWRIEYLYSLYAREIYRVVSRSPCASFFPPVVVATCVCLHRRQDLGCEYDHASK